MEFKIYESLPEEAKQIRIKVFVEEQGFQEEFDDADKGAVHIVIFENGIAAATCRFFYSSEKESFVIGRVAVRKEFRNKHYGAKLMELAEKEIANRCGKIVTLSAQYQVEGFYEKLGYKKQEDIFLEENYPHIAMTKEL